MSEAGVCTNSARTWSKRRASPGAGAATPAVAAGGVTLSMDGREPDGLVDAVNCTAAVNLPVPQQGCPANQVCARPGVVLGGAAGVIFDPLGRPANGDRSLAGAATITVTGQPNIVVQADSGWVQ